MPINNVISREKMLAIRSRWLIGYPVKTAARETKVCVATVKRYYRMFSKSKLRNSGAMNGEPGPALTGETAGGGKHGARIQREGAMPKIRSKRIEPGPLEPLPTEIGPFERAMREEESGLAHAVKRGVNIDSNGNRIDEIAEHYLTCRKCELRERLGLPREDPLRGKR